jgi:hypothetical protein
MMISQYLMRETGRKKFKILRKEQETSILQITSLSCQIMKERTLRTLSRRFQKTRRYIFNSKPFILY